jgi:N-acyl-D-amino-acid deacylase
MLRRSVGFIGLMGVLAGCGPSYDTILRHGTVYDGTGAAPVTADVAIKGDTVAAIGDLSKARGRSSSTSPAWRLRPASSTC